MATIAQVCLQLQSHYECDGVFFVWGLIKWWVSVDFQ
jgi:hypothetical protein